MKLLSDPAQQCSQVQKRSKDIGKIVHVSSVVQP